MTFFPFKKCLNLFQMLESKIHRTLRHWISHRISLKLLHGFSDFKDRACFSLTKLIPVYPVGQPVCPSYRSGIRHLRLEWNGLVSLFWCHKCPQMSIHVKWHVRHIQSRKNISILLASKLDNVNFPTLWVNCKCVLKKHFSR
jgi:hypothetical protein